jgi:hypothetical protein
MIASSNAPGFTAAIDPLQARFLTILPRIQAHAQIYFRHVACRARRADCIAETVALSWRWFVGLAQKGKDATQFATVLASYAARAVRSGRRVCGQERAQDAMSSVAQQRHGFAVGKLPDMAMASANPLAEALADNTKTPPPDAAAFRVDFPAWTGTYSRRRRRMIHDLARGERTMDVARRFRLSPGRVSQLRRAFEEDWTTFCGEAERTAPADAVA